EVGNYFTPKLSRRILHQLYLGYPDSAAARGLTATDTVAAQPARRRPRRPVRAVTRMRVPRPVKKAIRLVPGVHW
ncbi:MAG: SDR family oxidoreductase, partial [Mycobacterium sp.]